MRLGASFRGTQLHLASDSGDMETIRMGAEFWEHQTPYQPDAGAALRRLQTEVFRESGYNLTKILNERVNGMAESVRACEQDDPYDLLGHYRDALRRLRRLAAREVPEDLAAQVARLREIEAISSDSAPGILALVGVSPEWEEWKARLLTAEQIDEVFGTSTPTAGEVGAGVGRLADSIDRGMAVCFPVFEGGRPVSWYFAGYTAD